MTIRFPFPDQCWEVRDRATGVHPNEEAWPHHRTQADAQVEVNELLTDDGRGRVDLRKLYAAPAFAGPCAVVICDDESCGYEFGFEDEGSHLDPRDPTEWLRQYDWQELVDGSHRCTEHHVLTCDGCHQPTAVFDEQDGELCVRCANLRHPERVLA